MMYSFSLIIIAATLDIIANLLMEKSKGFKHKRFGVPALVLVCIAFTLLAKVTQFMDLAVAYITWGAFAILGTVLSARVMFKQRLNLIGWVGIAMIFASIVLLNVHE
ncbi:ligand-binding protein SH3 [bacterium]|jgi:spermidine export protein MdtI|nr:ligand-binding protein SH3 [bacterium]